MDKALNRVIKRQIVLAALSGVAIICLMLTITYGLYQKNHTNTIDQEIAVGDFDVDLTSNSGQITLADLKPGDAPNTSYTFTTSNSGDYIVNYNVYLTDNTTTFMQDSTNASTYSGYTSITSENYQYINFQINDGVIRPLSDVYNSTTNKFNILGGILVPDETYTYSIKFSVASNAPNSIQGNILALNITMDAAATDETGVGKIRQLATGSNTSSVNVITKTPPSGASCTNTLAYDGTPDANLRFVGADPCNYVSFNNESWRIIGVMNNIDDGTGKLEARLKLIRATSLGDYSWDTSEAEVNSGTGINDWTQADLKYELNGDYLNTSLNANTTWYNGSYNTKTGTFDYTKGLSAASQELIKDAKWNLGGFVYSLSSEIPNQLYKAERGTTTYSTVAICNDGACPRATEWIGKVALMYPSDYGYATAGGINTDRNICIGTLSTVSSTSGEAWNNDLYSDCKDNDWLKPSSGYNWLLSPASNAKTVAFDVGDVSNVNSDSIWHARRVLPTLYLKADVKITGGDGSQTNPYTLG